MVCIRCQKRPAIIFIQRMDNGQMKQEGYCLHCARELHIKPVDDLMKQFGMSDQDLDNMENRMESMMEELKRVAIESVEACENQHITDWTGIKGKVKSNITGYLYKTTRRSPMILPVIAEV